MRERRSNDGGCGACGRMDRPAVGMARPAFWWACRPARRGRRAAPSVGPGIFRPGIGVYFLLKVEPPLWPGFATAIAGVGVVTAVRRYRVWFEAALAFTVFATGFALMRETAWEHETPMLQRHLGPVAVTGRVVDIDLMEKGWRIIIEA